MNNNIIEISNIENFQNNLKDCWVYINNNDDKIKKIIENYKYDKNNNENNNDDCNYDYDSYIEDDCCA
ncbi:4531_t:CDS:2, partial [Entrophospora sp. SA101]